MQWNHDGDEPLMTRRKFFFLAGMTGAYVVAQQAGLVALAEPHVFVPKKMYPFSMSYATINSVLKDVYEPFIREQLDRHSDVLKALMAQEEAAYGRRVRLHRG